MKKTVRLRTNKSNRFACDIYGVTRVEDGGACVFLYCGDQLVAGINPDYLTHDWMPEYFDFPEFVSAEVSA